MNANVSEQEVAKFSALASRWWDPDGPQRPLHELNPVRLGYVRKHQRLQGSRVLDIGCGGGLLTEALAGEGASATGIDLSEKLIDVARMHLLESGRSVEYRLISAEQMALERPQAFDAVTCMEMLEHVPDPHAILQASFDLLKPGGRLFLSTLNRTPKAFGLAILAAEYLVRLLPKGTHDYRSFIKPSELAASLREIGFELRDVRGLRYDPLSRKAALSNDTSVNYLMMAEKPNV